MDPFPKLGMKQKMKFEHYVSRKNRQWPEGLFEGMNISWESKVPPQKLPPRINPAILRDYLSLVSLNKALLGPCFLGGVALGGVP